jgi:hypothetical protein
VITFVRLNVLKGRPMLVSTPVFGPLESCQSIGGDAVLGRVY